MKQHRTLLPFGTSRSMASCRRAALVLFVVFGGWAVHAEAPRQGLSSGASMAGISWGGAPAHAQSCTTSPEPGINWTRCRMDGRQFSGVDLSGSRLREARFNRADLSNAILEGVDGYRAKFVRAELEGIQLDGAVLGEADMSRANLRGASLKGSDLRRVRLYRADLTGADLTGADLRGADLLEARLDGATWTDGTRVCGEGSLGLCN